MPIPDSKIVSAHIR